MGYSIRLVVERVAEDFERFIRLRLAESLALSLEFLVEANDGVLHAFVGLGRPAQQNEVLAARYAAVAVLGVEADTQKAKDFFLARLFFVRHWTTPRHHCVGITPHSTISSGGAAGQPQ